MKKIDLSGCKPGDVLIREDDDEVVFERFAEKKDEDGRKITAVVCSDLIYRRLDGYTPYGYPIQNIKGFKKVEKKKVFDVKIVHSYCTKFRKWKFEVGGIGIESQKSYGRRSDAVRGAKRFFKKIGMDYKIVEA